VQTIPQQASSRDRLGSTLFLAALAHGIVILGVTFSAGVFDPKPVPSLNVTLLVDRSDEQPLPDKADFIAQRNQQGGGRAAEGIRPTTALSADHPLAQPGDPNGADLTDGKPLDVVRSAEQLVTRAASTDQVNSLPDSTEQPADSPQKAAALIDHLAPQTLAAELDLRAELPKSDDASSVAAPSAAASDLAEYLDGWRRRVERVGTANFPPQFLGNTTLGRPTLEVVIGRDGRLDDIVIRHSSGDNTLDQAALNILRLASPFEPLPEKIAAKYASLRFAYEWDFVNGADRLRAADRLAEAH
jgi:periplasmic protein TonB